MSVDWILAVSLVESIAWPFVALFAIFLFREPFSKLIAQIANRVDKLSLSLFGVSIELSGLREYSKSNWKSPADIPDLIKTALKEDYSDLKKMISTPPKADYAIIDLGSGDEWSTSRLFLFALLFDKVHELKAFVFVEESGGISGKFLYVARPIDVWKSLAIQDPWLGETLLQAAVDYIKPKLNDVLLDYIRSKPDVKFDNETQFNVVEYLNLKLDAKKYVGTNFSESFAMIIQNFARRIQTNDPEKFKKDEYYKIMEPQTRERWERGHLINGTLLQNTLRNNIDYSWCEESYDRSRSALAEAIAHQKGAFVSLVDKDRRFVRLVDRYNILDQIARNL